MPYSLILFSLLGHKKRERWLPWVPQPPLPTLPLKEESSSPTKWIYDPDNRLILFFSYRATTEIWTINIELALTNNSRILAQSTTHRSWDTLLACDTRDELLRNQSLIHNSPAIAVVDSRQFGNGKIVSDCFPYCQSLSCCFPQGRRMEELREFIQQFLDKTGLPRLQIEKRSGGKIKDSTIEDILNGRTKSISVDKLNALAEGMGVDAIELFKIASGKKTVFNHEDPWPSHILIKSFEAIISSPELTEIVKALLVAKPAKIKAVKKVLQSE